MQSFEEKKILLEEREGDLIRDISKLINEGKSSNVSKIYHTRKTLQTTQMMLRLLKREYEKTQKLSSKSRDWQFL